MKRYPLQKNTCKGVTIIELTVVISLIILLLSILLLGARFYMNSSSRSACIVNINGIHKAVRSSQNINNIATGTSISVNDFVGEGKALPKMPICPQSNGTYIIADEISPIGEVMVFCEEYDADIGTVDNSLNHNPSSTPSW